MKSFLFAGGLLVVLGMPAWSYAQVARATLTGVITDGDGTVVPGATVTFANAGTLGAIALPLRAATPPKLLVILAVDQMRADYLTRFDRHWRAGFRTLLDEGAVFEHTAYPYLNTVTCAGHATMSTGTFPRTHGMVLNGWWHRDERRVFNCTDDAAATDISYGRPSKLGNGPGRLLVPTLGDELRAQQPGARVVTLSLKPRSAIGLAGHGGDAVTWFEESVGSFVTSRAFTTRPVKAVKEFVDRNPYEKDLGRVWTLKSSPDAYLQADARVGERPPGGWSSRFPHPIRGRAGTDAQFYELWQSSPLSDSYLARLAVSLIDSFELGRREPTDFLGVSFSALDLVGHNFGPDSREVEDLLIHLDDTLGTLIAHLDARVGRDKYLLALSADHGVAPIIMPGSAAGRVVTEDVRDIIEETLTTYFGPPERGTYVDAINYTYVYLAPGVFDRLRNAPDAMRAVEEAVGRIPGVDRVLRADRLEQSDPAARAAALGHMPSRSGDFVIVPRASWIVAGRAVTNATTHGTAQPYDARVPLILFGHGIRKGRYTEPATPADIAPTLARVAGVTMPKAEGNVLVNALDDFEGTPGPRHTQ